MNSFGAQLPSLVALAAHVAICVTGVSVAGTAALWLCHSRSAPLRHALALGVLLATLVVPPVAALYQYRVIRFSFGSSQHIASAAAPVAPGQNSAALQIEEEVSSEAASRSGNTKWTFIACAAFAVVWAAGTLLLVVRTLLANRRQRQHLALLWPVNDAVAIALVDRLRRKLGIRRRVQLLAARGTPWPFTIGLIHPRIVVPSDLLEASSRSRLEAVLLHELAHVGRCDCGVASIEEAARLVHWWNPLIAVLCSHIAAAREEICDDYVLNHAGDGPTLADYLFESVQRAADARLCWGVGLSPHDPLTVARRIARLLLGNKHTTTRTDSVAGGALIVGAVALAFALIGANYSGQEQLIFAEYFDGGAITDKWTAPSAGLDLIDGQLRATDNGRMIRSLQTFSGDVRLEFDIKKSGFRNHTGWDISGGFRHSPTNTRGLGILRFDHLGVDAIATGTDAGSIGNGAATTTIDGSAPNQGHVTITYEAPNLKVAFKNSEGQVLHAPSMERVMPEPFQISMNVAAFADSPRFIDNIELYSLTVPEPSTNLMCITAGGLSGLVVLRRWRKVHTGAN